MTLDDILTDSVLRAAHKARDRAQRASRVARDGTLEAELARDVQGLAEVVAALSGLRSAGEPASLTGARLRSLR